MKPHAHPRVRRTGSSTAVTVAELLAREAGLPCALVPEVREPSRAISVAALLRREGCGPHSIDRPLLPRGHSRPAAPPRRQRRMRKATAAASALLAVGAVVGSAIVDHAVRERGRPGTTMAVKDGTGEEALPGVGVSAAGPGEGGEPVGGVTLASLALFVGEAVPMSTTGVLENAGPFAQPVSVDGTSVDGTVESVESAAARDTRPLPQTSAFVADTRPEPAPAPEAAPSDGAGSRMFAHGGLSRSGSSSASAAPASAAPAPAPEVHLPTVPVSATRFTPPRVTLANDDSEVEVAITASAVAVETPDVRLGRAEIDLPDVELPEVELSVEIGDEETDDEETDDEDAAVEETVVETVDEVSETVDEVGDTVKDVLDAVTGKSDKDDKDADNEAQERDAGDGDRENAEPESDDDAGEETETRAHPIRSIGESIGEAAARAIDEATEQD